MAYIYWFVFGYAVSTLLFLLVFRHKLFTNTEEKKVEVIPALLPVGKSGDLELEKNWLAINNTLFDTFCSKQHDYGPDNIGLGGIQGVVIRMGDKMSRLWNLTGVGKTSEEINKNALVSNESLEDTLLDIADYAIIGTLVLRKQWKKVATQDVWGVKSTNGNSALQQGKP